MNYLLDTCIVSELTRPKPYQPLIDWLEGCNEECLNLSVLTLGEIQKGVARLKDSAKKSRLQQWLDGDLRQRFSQRILPITDEIALAWGTMQGRAEDRGRPIPSIDGLLGATAIVHNLTIVTRNESDLAATGAAVFNPWRT
jgi:toxin FitB